MKHPIEELFDYVEANLKPYMVHENCRLRQAKKFFYKFKDYYHAVDGAKGALSYRYGKKSETYKKALEMAAPFLPIKHYIEIQTDRYFRFVINEKTDEQTTELIPFSSIVWC